jgi:eukaryotic-like serine/threonine-protein kinase
MIEYPQRWGDYVLIRPLGSGGMGSVFLALTKAGGGERPCVIKRLNAETLSDPERLQRFRREADISRTISNSSIARTLHAGDHDGEPYIVQEFVEGRTLTQLASAAMGAEQELSPAVAAYIAQQVAHALAYAHQARIVHRDIAPSNVMVDFDGVVRLIDFGIARRGADASLTATGEFIGRVGYAAPEVRAGAQADPRSDIYSLGVLLWELLVGRPPAFEELKATPEPSARASGRLIPSALDQVVARAVSQTPSARFSTAAEFEQALGATFPAPFDGKSELGKLIGRCYDVDVERRNLREELTEGRFFLATGGSGPHGIANGPASAEATSVLPRARRDNDIPTALKPGIRRRTPLRTFALIAFPTGVALSIAFFALRPRDATAPEARLPAPAPVATTSPLPAAPLAPAPLPLPSPPGPAAAAAAVHPPRHTPTVTAARAPAQRPAAAPSPQAGVLLDHARDSLAAGEFDDAERDAKKVLDVGTPRQKSVAHFILGKVLRLESHKKDAAEEFAKAVELDSENSAAIDQLASIRHAGTP